MVLIKYSHSSFFPRLGIMMKAARRLSSEAVLLLEVCDKGDVLLLGVLGRDLVGDELLPCSALGLAL